MIIQVYVMLVDLSIYLRTFDCYIDFIPNFHIYIYIYLYVDRDSTFSSGQVSIENTNIVGDVIIVKTCYIDGKIRRTLM